MPSTMALSIFVLSDSAEIAARLAVNSFCVHIRSLLIRYPPQDLAASFRLRPQQRRVKKPIKAFRNTLIAILINLILMF